MRKSTKKCGHTRYRKHCLVCHLTRIGASRSGAKTAATRKNLELARAEKARQFNELQTVS